MSKKILLIFLGLAIFCSTFSLLSKNFIASATSANFGFTTKGTNAGWWAANRLRGSWFTCSQNGTATNITAYITQYGADTPHIKFAIYRKSNDTLVGYTEELHVTSGWGWITFDIIVGGSLEAGDYWLVGWTDADCYVWRNTEVGKYGYEDLAYGAFPDPWTPTTGDFKYSIYCTYTPRFNIGEFAAPSTVYANEYFFLNATILHADGVAAFNYSTLEISYDVILKWVNSTNTFSKLYDPNVYCVLDASTSVRTSVNATAYQLSWYIKLVWPYPEGLVNVVEANTRVYDNSTEWSSGSYTGLFTYQQSLTYEYVFYGLYDEVTGEFLTTGVNVTAYFTDETSSATFLVNGTYTYGPSTKPQYFHFNLSNDREYWLSESECTGTFYIFETTTTVYTISFLDLTNVLGDYPFVAAKRYVNGTLRTIEKRIADQDDKVVMSLRNGDTYGLYIRDDVSYDYGAVVFTDVVTMQLVLKGVEFPKETLLTSKNVRIYGLREFDDPTGTITITYEDLLAQTNSVDVYINYKNGTNVYNITETTDSFVLTWTSAANNTDYAVVCDIDHQRYGTYSWKQYFPRTFSEMPWALDFLGSLPFNTAYLLPSLLIVFVAGCFTVLNAQVGAFLTVIVSMILAYVGWLPIPAATLIVAFTLAILMAIAYAKRRSLG